MKRQKGFSLIELLIVVAIILIIAAIAIPNLMRSRIAANEASAVASVRTIGTAELTYFNSYNDYAAIGELGGSTCNSATPTISSTSACLIDNSLATAVDTTHLKSGYYFTTPETSTTVFVASATPGTPGTSGVRYFCAAQDAVVRAGTSTAATSAACLGYNAL